MFARGCRLARVLVDLGCRLLKMIHERNPIATKELASDAERSQLLGSLIAKLIEIRRSLVNQAAELLGIPVGTVKSRVYYALRALRLVLAEQGVSL